MYPIKPFILSLASLVLTLPAVSAAPPPGVSDADGTVHVPAFLLLESSLLDEAIRMPLDELYAQGNESSGILRLRIIDERATNDDGERDGDHEPRHRARTLHGRVPRAQVIDDPWEESRLGHTEEEAQHVEAGDAVDEHHPGGRAGPRHQRWAGPYTAGAQTRGYYCTIAATL